jgi:hypothetical protein
MKSIVKLNVEMEIRNINPSDIASGKLNQMLVEAIDLDYDIDENITDVALVDVEVTSSEPHDSNMIFADISVSLNHKVHLEDASRFFALSYDEVLILDATKKGISVRVIKG